VWLVFTVQGMVGLLHSAGQLVQAWLLVVVFFHTNPRAAAAGGDLVGFSGGFLEELPGGWWPGQWPVQAADGDEIKRR